MSRLGRFLARRRERRRERAYQRARLDALVRASNGERLPRREREALDLPDWTS